jgi:hypothetical protein
LKGYTISMNGGSTSGAYNLTNWLGVVADFGGYHGYPSESLTGETFTLGPRFSYRRFHWLQPFAEGLAGGSHFNMNSGGITGGGAKFTPGAGRGGRCCPRPPEQVCRAAATGLFLGSLRRLEYGLRSPFDRH